ncbi:protein krueppel-like [Rhipicephalus sanguineus]|uniref:protein krueppel-like n=1 Tax=Rhipicephalus sanguineus TaxID=34632 RepID=UPI001894BDC5|nr:protein krueppel-like [Rhipicephalus sanguineus]
MKTKLISNTLPESVGSGDCWKGSDAILLGVYRGGSRSSSRAAVPQNVRRFHCSFCNYSTIYKQTLQRHHRTHTGERPFECEFCLKTFAQKCNMKAHQRLHTGACPYRCQFCQLGFSRRELLTEHLQQEHEMQLAFKCGYCSSGFLTRHELWRHLRSCSPWGAPTPDAIVASVVASVPVTTQPPSSPT